MSYTTSIGKRNAVRVEFELDGFEELKHYLRKTLPNAFEDATIDALQKAAYDGKERAKSLVPVDTGALRRSIRVERLAKEARKIYYTGIRAGGYIRNPRTNKLVDYAGYVEYGTSRQRPQPFIRPSSEYAMKRLPNYFWSELYRRVERA